MTDIETKIHKIARDVYESLGSGHPEVVYNRAMQVDLRLQSINYESEKVLEVKYKGHYVGDGHADLVVGSGDDMVVVELKVGAYLLGDPEKQQLNNYMKSLGVKKGVLINFQKPEARRSKPSNHAGPEFILIE